MRALAARFEQSHPGLKVVLKAGGSVDLARAVAHGGPTPDVLALADYQLLPRLLVPSQASWYAAFAGNAMVVAYTNRSRYAGEVTGRNWTDVLRRPGVRAAHSDPAQDPAGYRALLVFHLAERALGERGLGRALEREVPTHVGRKGESLYDALRAGDLDYVVTYRSSALTTGLRFVELSPDIDLGDPGREATYAAVSLPIAREPGSSDSTSVRGEPILYGVTVPARARNRSMGERFVRELLGVGGQSILAGHGFLVSTRPAITGAAPAGLR